MFPYAAKGVKKIFSAEILTLIGAIIGGIASIFAVLANASTNEGTMLTLGLIMLVLIVAAGVMILVGAIINIVGYAQASKDEEGFRKALVCTIFSFILSFVSNLFINQTGFIGWLSTAMNVFAQILSMCVIIFTILGLMNLSAKCHREDMVLTGAAILKALVVLYIVSYIATFITRYFRENAFNSMVVALLAGFTIILTVVLYFFQLYYLAKASKMLREN